MSARRPPLLLILSNRNPEDQTEPLNENKQQQTELKQGLVAQWFPFPRKEWKEEALSCSQLALKQGVRHSCPDRSPVWSTEWKEIKQHISASLQLLGPSFWYCCFAEYQWEYRERGENIFQLFIPPQNKHQRSLCMTYYIIDIQAQCRATIISHLETVAVVKWWFTTACILHYLSAQRWGGWRLVRLKSKEGEGSNCWCRSH